MRTRHITGIQLHHHTALDDAMRHLSNAAAALGAAITATGDPGIVDLDARLAVVRQDAGRFRDRARAQFDHLIATDRPTFEAARDGDIPYPDEVGATFVPRCRCHDRCVPCESDDEQAALDEGWTHVCLPCRAHPGDRND